MQIYVEGQSATWQNLDSLKLNDAYFQQSIDFCKQWLSGSMHFQMQTSGSSGKPKKISFHRSQLKASARMTAEFLNLQPYDKALICLNTEYIAGKMMLIRAMQIGMEAYLIKPSSTPLADFTEDILLDFAAFVPLQMQSIMENKKHNLERLEQMKAIIIGGAAVAPDLIQKIEKIRKVAIYATYGMTETVTHIAMRRLNGRQKTRFYHTLPEVRIRQDQRGCLVVASPSTNFEEVVSNDSVTILNGKEFEYLGRIDFIINSGGIKIQPEKIENAVARAFMGLGLQYRFFVAGMPDKDLGERVSLFIETEKPFEPDLEKALLQFLQKQNSKYEQPKSLYYLPKFAETPTAKIDRNRSKQKLQKLNPQY